MSRPPNRGSSRPRSRPDLGSQAGSPNLPRDGHQPPFLNLVVVAAYVFGASLVGAGVWLLRIGAVSITELSIWGAKINTSSAGLVVLLFGVVVVVLLVTRALKAYEDTNRKV